MNREWATEQLDAFLVLSEFYRRADPPGVVNFTSQLSTRGAQTRHCGQRSGGRADS